MSFLRQFLIYGVAGAASRLAAVVLVPLYTRTLPIADYGQLELLTAIYGLMVIFAGMQVESAVARDYFASSASGRLGDLMWSSLYISVAGTVLVGALLLAARGLGWLPGSLDAETVGLLTLVALPTQVFGVQLVALRFAANAVFFSLVSFCDLALCAAFSLLFIVGMHLGVKGALLGLICGKTACMLAAWRRTFGATAPARPSARVARPLLAYGIPAIPAVVVNWAQNAGSRVLLAGVLTLNDVALAAIAVKVAAVYGFVIASFRLAWEPFSIEKLSSVDSDPHVYNRALEWYVATMFFTCGGCAVIAPYLIRILAPPSYAAGATMAVFFLFSQFWVGVSNVVVIGIHAARRTGQLLPVYGAGAVVNALLLLALAPRVGVVSAGVASLAGSVVTALLAAHFSNRHLQAKFRPRLIFWCLAGTVAFAAVDFYAGDLLGRAGHRAPGPLAVNFAVGASLIAITALVLGQAIPRVRIVEMISHFRAPGRQAP